MPNVRPSILAHSDAAAPDISVSVIGSLPPVKGISAYTAQLVAALAEARSAEVDVIGFSSIYPRFAYPGGEPNEAAAQTPAFDGVCVRNMLSWYNPISWLRGGFAIKADVVHAQWWSYALAPVYVTVLGLARLRGKRVVLTVHNVEPHEGGIMKRALNRAVFRFGQAFIVHSEQNRQTLQRMLGGDASRISVLPHGVLDTPRTGMSRAAARMRLGVPGDAKMLLYFGHIRPYKGVDVLLRAFADVVRAEPAAMLVIAGKPWGDWTRYGRLIDELGIAGSVRLHLDFVPTPEIESYFVATDAVVLPYTHFDAQTGVGTRALPFGRPLIVSDTGGLPELVIDRAMVVPPGDPAALARVIARVLGDAALRERLSADSLVVAKTLGWARIAAQTIAVYNALLGREPTTAQAADQAVAQASGARRP